ncbi:MAG: MFS transporter [Chitinophagales bacterium]|jgi:Na+/melibiose symporter-like transporter|nr:MFS transporter [Chitinophagales bacterium]
MPNKTTAFPTTATQPVMPSNTLLLLYAVGQLGWSLASFAPINLLNYYYLPPEDGKMRFLPLLAMPFLLGVINGASRAFDAFIDPLVANSSDRSKSSLGRRKVFMLIAFLPFAALSVLVFCPPVVGESWVNTLFVAAMIFLFHIFLSLYTTPYSALVSELGHTSTARLKISSMISIAYALGLGIGNQVYAVEAYLDNFFLSDTAFRLTLVIFAGIAAVCMVVPILFVNEKKYCAQQISDKTSTEAIRSVLQRRDFRIFITADLVYWMALTFVQSGLVYYVTVLLRMDKSVISLMTPVVLLLNVAMYVPVNYWANRYGKKVLLQHSFLLFAFVYAWVAMLGKIPLPNYMQGLLLIMLLIVPMTVFSILPTAVVADIADADGKQTGDYKAGMFFGVRILAMKLGVALANVLFSWCLLLGKSTANDFGIRLTAIGAMMACLLAWRIFADFRTES